MEIGKGCAREPIGYAAPTNTRASMNDKFISTIEAELAEQKIENQRLQDDIALQTRQLEVLRAELAEMASQVGALAAIDLAASEIIKPGRYRAPFEATGFFVDPELTREKRGYLEIAPLPSRATRERCVFFGPYKAIDPGKYRLFACFHPVEEDARGFLQVDVNCQEMGELLMSARVVFTGQILPMIIISEDFEAEDRFRGKRLEIRVHQASSATLRFIGFDLVRYSGD